MSGSAPGARAAVIAVGAVSPFGRGRAAYETSPVDLPAPVAIVRDDVLAKAGFSRTLVARVPDTCLSTSSPTEVRADRASHLLYDAFSDALEAAEHLVPALRSRRWGVAVGTSSGGMLRAEKLFAAIERGDPMDPSLARASTYFAPFERVLHALAVDARRSTHLVTACAASTWATGLALSWLRRGEVDVAFAGGYDAHSGFVQAGFDALRATSLKMPAPFRVGRDGMALGEGAAILVLIREADLGAVPARFFVSGFGASTDAVHITAPDRTGAGLARAARRALFDAGVAPSEVAFVSVHGTATPYNDAMEAKAISSVFGDIAQVVLPTKAQIGHTLGAAGVLETLAAYAALDANVLPSAAGTGELDPDTPVRLLETSVRAAEPLGIALKQSAAFGGANAAIVVAHPRAGAAPSTGRTPNREVYVAASAHASRPDIDLVCRETHETADRVARIDPMSLLAATAVARLLHAVGTIPGLASAALVTGHALATVDINHRFYARILAKGPAAAEPRLFPPTSPNLVAGQLAILFGIGGPSVAACRGLDGGVEALELGQDLVADGTADLALVVAVDGLGEVARTMAAGLGVELEEGACAALLTTAERGHALSVGRKASALGHRGLLEVVSALEGARS